MRVFPSLKVTTIIPRDSKNMINPTKKHPPTIAKISRHKKYLKSIKKIESNIQVHMSKEAKKLTSCGTDEGNMCQDNPTDHWYLDQLEPKN